MEEKFELKKISNFIWEMSKHGTMNVPGKLFMSESILEKVKEDGTLKQIYNMASLPGIVKNAIALPDAHVGYGLCIGGVAAFDLEEGIISPGGIGFDINCGVRLLSTNLTLKEVQPKIKELLDLLYKEIPSGVGEEGLRRLTDEELFSILKEGPRYLVEKENIGTQEEIDHCEENGELKDADPTCVPQRAKSRGRRQLGTLGAGNHFIEIQTVQEIFDKKTAEIFGITKENQICLIIHTGSRGLGHQVASDYLRMMEDEYPEVISKLPEKDLIYAPFKSDLGQKYYKAMCAAANFAWANRHYIANLAKNPFKKLFPNVEFRTIYDVAHNIAKIETHLVDGKEKQLLVHRKGATRSLGPENILLPKAYLHIGQPVLIPGSMGTASFLLVGTNEAEDASFSSTAHGAGRLMSRFAAKKEFVGEEIKAEMEKENIFLKVGSIKGVADEAPQAYKDVDEVVKVSHEAKIGNLVAKLKPLGVIKG
ncbi:MAG: RtcB family protein [Candidatus Woesearchaeota archaeon]